MSIHSNNYLPINLIKEKMSKSTKRIAIIQTVLSLCAIIVGVVLYQLILELLKIPQEVLEDPDALLIYLESTMSIYLASLTIVMFMGFFMFILSIIYLVSIFQLSSSFARLGVIEPKVGQVAKYASNFLRTSIILVISGAFLTFISPEITIYISFFMYLASAAIMAAGYFFISRTFKILHELGLFPKKESRLIFYGQIAVMISIAPLLFTRITIPLTLVIITGVIALGGLTCVIVGFFKLSKDALLIKGITVSATSLIQVQTGFKDPTIAPNTVYTSPQSHETAYDKETLSEPDVRFCYNCGAKLFVKTQFCENCGVEIEE